MRFLIPLEIPDADLERVAEDAIRRELQRPGWHNEQGGRLYEAIRKKILEVADEMLVDVRPMICEQVGKSLPGILEGVVDQVLRQRVKAVAKKMERKGELVTEGKTEGAIHAEA